jgi:nucleoside-diphosphate-sugar epimerase
MRILMIGGTRFVGRHMVEAALASGHQVTVFHRGQTGPDLFPGVERRVGDRNGDLSELGEGSWDATIDTCAYVPRHVHTLADALGDRAGHYLLVSSVSVYAAPDHAGYDEGAALLELPDPTVEEVTNETYGGLKVLCERAAVDRFGASALLVRPTYVVGPDDYTWRFPWWVQRLARGGEVLAPGPADAPAQVIDVRDMATWTIGLLEQREAGAFHAVSPAPPFSFRDQLEAIASVVAPAGTTLSWVDEDFLLAAGHDDGSFPLWSGGDPDRFVMAADPGAALRTGLVPRPLAETVRDTWSWMQERDATADLGITPDREAETLRAWKEHEQQRQDRV